MENALFAYQSRQQYHRHHRRDAACHQGGRSTLSSGEGRSTLCARPVLFGTRQSLRKSLSSRFGRDRSLCAPQAHTTCGARQGQTDPIRTCHHRTSLCADRCRLELGGRTAHALAPTRSLSFAPGVGRSRGCFAQPYLVVHAALDRGGASRTPRGGKSARETGSTHRFPDGKTLPHPQQSRSSLLARCQLCGRARQRHVAHRCTGRFLRHARFV